MAQCLPHVALGCIGAFSSRLLCPQQLNPTSAGDSSAYLRRASSDNDVVIVSALRTAVCKAKRGGFKDTPADDLLSAVLKATLEQTGVEAQARYPHSLILLHLYTAAWFVVAPGHASGQAIHNVCCS